MMTRLLSFARRRGPGARALVVLAALLPGTRLAQAQTADTYAFAPSAGTFAPLPATATNVPAVQADDALSGTLPLGFTFVFDGASYTSCAVSSNGWLTFNPTAAGSSLTNDLAAGAASERPRVAPFWDDLDGRTGGVASYLTTGTAPNRTFTFEWLNWYRYGNASVPSFSMQVQLVEGSNVVRFVYRQEPNPISGASASIGLSGGGTGPCSFLSLSDASAAPVISSAVESDAISAVPATGQVYSFTPPMPSACPTPRCLAATALTATSATLGYSVSNAAPGPFTIQYGAAGFNPALPASATNVYTTVTSAGLTAPVTGLTANTTHTFYATQNCGGSSGSSSRSNAGTFTTSPNPAVNDNCAQALALPVTASCAAPVSGTLFGATQSLPPTATCGFGTAASDVWYSFVASASAQQLTTTAQFFSGYYDVRVGTCAASTSLGCGPLGTVAAPSQAVVSGLTAGTTYYLRIYSANATPVPIATSNFTLCLTPVLNYCNTGLGGTCGANTVTAVSIAGTTLNATGLTCAVAASQAYTAYPATGANTATLQTGTTYQLSVTLGTGTIAGLWIDYNRNLALEPSEYTPITASSTGTGPTVVSINLPTNAVQGLTTLRIRTRSTPFNLMGPNDACTNFGTFSSGETKDFTITIGAPASCPTASNVAVSGITATAATLTFTSSAAAATYTVTLTPASGLPVTQTVTASPVSFTALTASTAYTVSVVANCAGGVTSGPSAASFTTACLTPAYAALPVVEGFEGTWLSRCDTREVPTNNWRNTPATGDPSWRRDDDGVAGAWTSPNSWAYAPTASQGARSARFHSGEVQLPGDPTLVGTLDLFVNLSAAGAKRLSFDYINTSGSDSLTVDLSNDGGATFSRLVRYNQSGTVAAGFSNQVLNIVSTSATAVLRFRARGDYGVTDIGLDNIVLESATGCLTPAVLTATTTTTTASLSWLPGGTGTYTVLYGPTGFNPALPSSATNVYTTATGLTGPPYAVTGLTPGTTYQFYVTLNCAAGANSGTAGPASFSTQILNDEPCGATTLPINNICTPLATTTVGATATPGIVAGTCSGFPTTTPLDVWFKFTTAATGPASTAVRIAVTGASANTVRIYSGACTGPLVFLTCASSGNGTSAAPNADATGLMPNTTYYVRVGAYNTFQPPLGNFTICATPVPNCAPPTGLGTGPAAPTTAVLNWFAAPVAGSTFTVYYGPAGFVPPAGTALTGLTAQTTTLTGLLPSTAYCFYVQQVCGGFNGSSGLAGPSCFTTSLTVPANNDPCGAVTIGAGATVSGSNVGATASFQPGIVTPACSPAALPQDVWFAFTASATTSALTVTGTAAGMVRVFTAPNCATGPFTQVFCQASGAPNTNVGPIALAGLTPGQRYYVAVSGRGSSDVTGAFTISASNVLAARAQAETDALLVYPNPSGTGQLTLRLSGLSGPATATLLNALGQVVQTQALRGGPAEHSLTTRGLATGVYTLRVAVADRVLTRKVVLE